MNFENNLRFKS